MCELWMIGTLATEINADSVGTLASLPFLRGNFGWNLISFRLPNKYFALA
jgi:hypothetical protein